MTFFVRIYCPDQRLLARLLGMQGARFFQRREREVNHNDFPYPYYELS